jgi:putative DNA primase/helicase
VTRATRKAEFRVIDGEHVETPHVAPVDRVVEIERLAALEPFAYEAARAEAAKRLSVRPSALDTEVKRVRKRLRLDKQKDDDSGQGRPVTVAEVVPWHEPVDGDRLATMLSCAIRSHVSMSDAAADAVALWCLHTWCFDTFHITPRLAVYSPTRGCGKTTLLSTVSRLVLRPKLAISISPAAMFRTVEAVQPTLLIDELRKFLERDSEMHGLLNAGHAKGMTVLRVLGDKQELREFSCFAPVAFGTLGRAPDDLEDRSIVIRLQRKRADDAVTPFRDGRTQHLDVLARQCARWCGDNAEAIADAADESETPGLSNRTADNWRPLFAIAAVIGGEWPARCAEAAAVLESTRDDDSTGTMLLADIRDAFEAEKTDKLPSDTIIERLMAMDCRPWPEFSAGKPLTQNKLARLLKPFGVAPKNVRAGERVVKGYELSDFADRFERYLAPLTPQQTATLLQAHSHADFCDFQTATGENGVAVQKCKKPLRHNDCSGVAVSEGDNPANTRICTVCGRPEAPGNRLLECYVADGELPALMHEMCSRRRRNGPGTANRTDSVSVTQGATHW